ncbi:MAG: thiamine pyrophosphate-binding protein [Chloroflexi bacterium]|nr:thiamine pyrophosphate-binding protein [Chloroflexota bacterium]
MPRLTGRYLFMEQLLAEGVKHVFGNPGTTEQAFMDALLDYPQVQYVLALQEAVAIGVADGYSRVAGVPAFVQLHIMPGLGNAMGMLYNAYRTNAPIVVYAGQHPQRGAVQEPLLAGDLVRFAQPVSKWAVEVQDAADIPAVVRRAFKVAMDPPRGPVFVSIPSNLMDEEAETDILPPVPTNMRVRPDPDAIERAAEWLLEAKSPLIVVGEGVSVSGAQSEVVRLAEALGARIHNTFAAETPVPGEHPLYAGLLNLLSAPGLRAQLSGADVILAVGTPVFLAMFPLEASPAAPGTKLVHIDIDPWELGKNWPVDLPLLADPKAALTDLLALLEARLTPEQREAAQKRAAAVQTMKEGMYQAIDASARARWDHRPMPPGRFAKEVADALDPSTLVYDESITVSGHMMRQLRFRDPGQHYRAAGGGLGPGLPATIGLKLARPDRPVAGIVGDGSALYTIQALWTAAHHRVPVTWLIANNASYRILKLNMTEYLGEGAAGRGFVAMDLTDPPLDFARIAESFGVKGVRIADPDEIGDAVREAQKSGEPRLIDVVIDGSIRSGLL